MPGKLDGSEFFATKEGPVIDFFKQTAFGKSDMLQRLAAAKTVATDVLNTGRYHADGSQALAAVEGTVKLRINSTINRCEIGRQFDGSQF